MDDFGSNLRAAREARGLSRPRLAAISGVPARTIEAYEVGGIEPSLDRAVKLARALRVSLDQLAGPTAPAAEGTGGGHPRRRAADADAAELLAALGRVHRELERRYGLRPPEPGEEDPEGDPESRRRTGT